MKLARVTKVAFAVIAVLIAIELVLQLVGWWLAPRADLRAGANAPADAIRILVLGESTTTKNSDKKVWADLLEEKLRAKGLNVFVVNKAMPGIDSGYILANLDYYLSAVRPQLVITMIGINDSNRWVAHVNSSPLRHLRLYRMATWLAMSVWGRIHSGPKALGILPAADPEFLQKQRSLSPQEWSPEERARFFEWASRQVPFDVLYKDKLMLERALRNVRRSLATDYFVKDSLYHFAEVLYSSEHSQECFEMFRKYILTVQGIAEPRILVSAQMCADDNPKLGGLLNANLWAIEYSKRDPSSASPVIEIYRRILESGAALVTMNYPRRKFSDETKASVEALSGRKYLVENRDNFEETLSHRPMSDVFTDTFAGDFGHTTQLGHDLIAENVSPVVLRAIDDLKRADIQAAH